MRYAEEDANEARAELTVFLGRRWLLRGAAAPAPAPPPLAFTSLQVGSVLAGRYPGLALDVEQVLVPEPQGGADPAPQALRAGRITAEFKRLNDRRASLAAAHGMVKGAVEVRFPAAGAAAAAPPDPAWVAAASGRPVSAAADAEATRLFAATAAVPSLGKQPTDLIDEVGAEGEAQRASLAAAALARRAAAPVNFRAEAAPHRAVVPTPDPLAAAAAPASAPPSSPLEVAAAGAAPRQAPRQEPQQAPQQAPAPARRPRQPRPPPVDYTERGVEELTRVVAREGKASLPIPSDLRVERPPDGNFKHYYTVDSSDKKRYIKFLHVTPSGRHEGRQRRKRARSPLEAIAALEERVRTVVRFTIPIQRDESSSDDSEDAGAAADAAAAARQRKRAAAAAEGPLDGRPRSAGGAGR